MGSMTEKSMPITKMLDYTENIYELANAVIKRSNQVTQTGSEELQDYHNKPVSLSMDEILSKKVLFRNKQG